MRDMFYSLRCKYKGGYLEIIEIKTI